MRLFEMFKREHSEKLLFARGHAATISITISNEHQDLNILIINDLLQINNDSFVWKVGCRCVKGWYAHPCIGFARNHETGLELTANLCAVSRSRRNSRRKWFG